MTALLDPSLLREMIRFEPETGKYFWRKRDARLFKKLGDCNAWNAKFADKETFKVIGAGGYCLVKIFDTLYKAHRVIWAYHYGEWPKDCIDHINGIKTDNRLENLRSVTRAENAKNLAIPRHNTSGIVGVRWSKSCGKWTAGIKLNRKFKHIGVFDSIEDAATARKIAEQEHGFHANHGRASN